MSNSSAYPSFSAPGVLLATASDLLSSHLLGWYEARGDKSASAIPPLYAGTQVSNYRAHNDSTSSADMFMEGNHEHT